MRDDTTSEKDNIISIVNKNIARNYPVYSTWAGGGNNHACVIYGVAPGVHSMLAMDPERPYDSPDEIGQYNLVSSNSNGFYMQYGTSKLYLEGICAKYLS